MLVLPWKLQEKMFQVFFCVICGLVLEKKPRYQTQRHEEFDVSLRAFVFSIYEEISLAEEESGEDRDDHRAPDDRDEDPDEDRHLRTLFLPLLLDLV